MSQTNSSNLLELLTGIHGGQEAPSFGPQQDRVVRSHVEHEGGVGDGDTVYTKLGDGALADGCYGQTRSDRNLKRIQNYRECSADFFNR